MWIWLPRQGWDDSHRWRRISPLESLKVTTLLFAIAALSPACTNCPHGPYFELSLLPHFGPSRHLLQATSPGQDTPLDLAFPGRGNPCGILVPPCGIFNISSSTSSSRKKTHVFIAHILGSKNSLPPWIHMSVYPSIPPSHKVY